MNDAKKNIQPSIHENKQTATLRTSDKLTHTEINKMRLRKVEDVAPEFQMNAMQLYRAIREQTFPFPQAIVRIGRQIRIDLDACERVLQQKSPSNTEAVSVGA